MTSPTSNNHPITPPYHLLSRWQQLIDYASSPTGVEETLIEAVHWGADKELEACCEWLEKNTGNHMAIEFLRDARRPKPPSLADEALEQLRGIETCVLAMHGGGLIDDVIHAALKRLKELEDKQQ